MSVYTRCTWDDVKSGHLNEHKPLYIGAVQDVSELQQIWNFNSSGTISSIIGSTILLLSLPFDITADTVCLPYDLYSYFDDKIDMWFWEDIFERNDTSLPLEKYQRHLTPVGFNHANNLLRWDRRGYREGDLTNQRDENQKRIRERIPHPQGKISLEMRIFFERLIVSTPKLSLPYDFYF
jgi:uncharacterized protein YceK